MGILVSKAIPVIIGILIFGVLILVHELGHFFAARKNGIAVLEFAIGMGPVLLKVQKGETLYTIRAIPMGGFCRMLGEDAENENNDRQDSFEKKSVWRRMIVIVAGAAMNMVLAVVIFTVVVSLVGIRTTTVLDTVPGSPAEVGGILPGDKVVKIGKDNLRIFDKTFIALRKTKGNPTEVVIQRDGQKIVKNLTPTSIDGEYKFGFTTVPKSGLFRDRVEGYDRAGVFETVRESFFQTFFWVEMTFYGISEMAAKNIPVSDMSGPIGVVSIISETYEQNVKVDPFAALIPVLNFAGVLSASIGIFNMLPIPALDGGRMVFLLIEAVRRKPVPQDKEGFVHFVGFVALIAFGIFIAYNDIIKLVFK